MLDEIKKQYNRNAFMYDGKKRTQMIIDVDKLEWLMKQNELYRNSLIDILDITEDTMELDVFTNIVNKALINDKKTKDTKLEQYEKVLTEILGHTKYKGNNWYEHVEKVLKEIN